MVTTLHAESPIVRVIEDERTITMENGRIRLGVDRATGEVRSIQVPRNDQWIELTKENEGLYWDANIHATDVTPEQEAASTTRRPRVGYNKARAALRDVRITEQSEDVAEVAIRAGETMWVPMAIEYRIRLERGRAGFHAWAHLRHGPGMGATRLEQTRFVIKGVPGTEFFKHWVVDDARVMRRPTSPAVETIQDATVRLADGSAFTKYDLTAFTHDYLAHGMVADDIGLWVLYPDMSSFNGGPIRQDLTVHDDSVLLAMFHSAHFGAGQIELAKDEVWSKFYGPVYFHINAGPSVQAMHDDAKATALAERAGWPYDWIDHPDYPRALGAVDGQVRLADGTPPKGAWVILAPQEEIDWALSARGYMFWSTVESDGRFSIRNVRPGTYRLIVSGGDQADDHIVSEVKVTWNHVTSLNTIEWKPTTFGERLWQIGRFDRSTREYRDGQEPIYRNYDAFRRYFQAFPDDVTFTIGTSNEATDWNFSHWSWFSRKPVWTIRFDTSEARRGEATLTIGLAAARPAGALKISINGTEIGSLDMPKSGAAGYRSAAQDSKYHLIRIPFDAALIKPGTNEITLGHTNARPVPAPGEPDAPRRPGGEMMYDAIRLEVR
jgi:rhamnogalacturonan endolyase